VDVVRSIALVPAYVLAVNLFFAPVQIRIWNYFNFVDFVIMIVLIVPFLATRWTAGATSQATRWLWCLCAAMAVDVLAFAIGTFLPTGGHPSLEALLSVFLGFLKVLLIPAGLVALVIASLRGERSVTVILGLICLIGETLYTVLTPNHPIRWIILEAFR